jgi:hypothetical protein
MMKLEYTTSRFSLVCMILLLLSACSQQARDREIKADITIKAKQDVNFTGVYFTVKDGTVSLWGKCPTEKSRGLLLQKLKTIHVIKSIDDRLIIGPVSIDSNFSLKQQVDSILAKYPGVSAELSGNGIHLLGRAKPAELRKMLESLAEVSSDPVDTALVSKDI